MKQTLINSRVVMYAKGFCPYCISAEKLLAKKGIGEFEKIRIDIEPGRREEMIALTGRMTVPQIYISDHHVGGCDDLHALERKGRLDELLKTVSNPPGTA